MKSMYLGSENVTNLWYMMRVITRYIPESKWFDENDRKLAENLKDFLEEINNLKIEEISEEELPF